MTATLNAEQFAAKSFDYGYARVRDFTIHAHKVEQKARGPKSIIDYVEVNGEKLKPSRRFWTSLQCRFGFSSNIFRYFDHEEVFNRISERAPDDKIRVCVERNADVPISTLLAVTNPDTAPVKFNDLTGLLNRFEAKEINYADGIVRSVHTPRVGTTPFDVAGDKFSNQFVIDTPVDGFGKPNIYLSLLRLVCTNGAVAFGKAFRAEINTGKKDEDIMFALVRAMDGFNNEDGFVAMRNRYERAAKSWASINETQSFYNLLSAMGGRGQLLTRGREVVGNTVIDTALPIFHDFHRMTGDINQSYGLADLNTLSTKRQRSLPTACKVYDLLNFASEVATHHATDAGNRSVQAFIGDMISNEYDLEGTVDHFSDWREFLINDSVASDTMQLIDKRKQAYV